MLQIWEIIQVHFGVSKDFVNEAECEHSEMKAAILLQHRWQVALIEPARFDSSSQGLYEDRLGLISDSTTRLEDFCLTLALLRTEYTSFVLAIDRQTVESDECICEKMLVHLLTDFSRYLQEMTYTVARRICHGKTSVADRSPCARRMLYRVDKIPQSLEARLASSSDRR